MGIVKSDQTIKFLFVDVTKIDVKSLDKALVGLPVIIIHKIDTKREYVIDSKIKIQ